MTDRENKALYIAEECRKAGMTMAGAAGVIANVENESAFISDNVQDIFNTRLNISDADFVRRVDAGDTALFMTRDLGFGLVQWTAQDRKAKFLAHFRQLGVSIGDFCAQVNYMLLDMRTFYDKRPWNTCTQSSNPYQAGYDMCKYYEICANLEADAQHRGRRAEEYWYNWLSAAYEHGAESTITDAIQQPPQTDDDGIVIPQTWPPRTIDENCSGWPEMWLLQALLKNHGYSVLNDGIWTENLKKTVQKVQKANGLAPDGVAGPKTWVALGIAPAVFKMK